LRVTLTYNLRQSEDEADAERFSEEYVQQLVSALEELNHDVSAVEVSGPPGTVVDQLLDSKPDLIFNMAEGVGGKRRESYYPAMYSLLGLPYTGGTPGLLHVGLDKRLAGKLLAVRGIRVPDGALLTPDHPDLPTDIEYPLFVKPNYEGSSMGITQESVVESEEEARKVIGKLMDKYPEGVIVEQFIRGREITVPMLSASPGYLLEIVEYEFEGDEHNIFDYDTKSAGGEDKSLKTICPPELSAAEKREILTLADRAFRVMQIPDFGRADIRLTEDGVPYLIEVNPLPGLRPISPLITGAKAKGLSYTDVIRLIIESARQRYQIEID
jgi:D-alanine--D-alanine ligase